MDNRTPVSFLISPASHTVRYIYALCTWGLGHASRSLPIMRALLKEGHEITVLTSGRSLRMLRNELGDSVEYVDIVSYPEPYSAGRFSFYLKFGLKVPGMIRTFRKEHDIVKKLMEQKKYHRIISDNRYGVYSHQIPSFLITHQLRLIAPKRIGFIERIGERFVAAYQDDFDVFIVPDDEEGTLSGELSHKLRYLPRKKILYSGPLSDFSKKEAEQDIDLLISISGPEPQRSLFERIVQDEQKNFPKNTVITLGKSETFKEGTWKRAKVYTYLSKEEREDIINRSKLILSRSGYSTIMDLAVLGKRAIFVPTPGQTEQEYLSDYHMEKGTYYSMDQSVFSLRKALSESRRYRGIEIDGRKSVERILDLVG